MRDPKSTAPYILQEPYIALIDMIMIWRVATPSAKDRQTQYDTSYKRLDYIQQLISIILGRHSKAEQTNCVNDPYTTAYSAKDNERNLQLQRNVHVPNLCMKLGEAFPLPEHLEPNFVALEGAAEFYLQLPD